MGSIDILQNQFHHFSFTYTILKNIYCYLDKYCSIFLFEKIAKELNENIEDILQRSYLSQKFLHLLFEEFCNDDDDEDYLLWYQTEFMEPIHHNFIRFYLMHFLGTIIYIYFFTNLFTNLFFILQVCGPALCK